MATSSRSAWRPDWTVYPGELLLEALEERGMTQTELARRMDRPLKTINEIVNGKAAITSDTAIQLERVLGISAKFWTGLETQYRDSVARDQAHQTLEEEAEWVDKFPVEDLVRRNLIQRGSSKAETLRNLLAFLGVSSPRGLERLSEAASYRTSAAFKASPYAVTAWLRWGELLSAVVETASFDRDHFRKVLKEIRSLTRREPFGQVLKRVQSLCAEAGVVLIVVPELRGTRLSGAARWISGRPVIQLTTRYKTNDQFWFTLFHEAGHILAETRRRDFVDAPDAIKPGGEELDDGESAANEFARTVLLPSDEYDGFVRAGDFSREAIRKIARDMEIAPAIVVGRLERDGHVAPGQLRDLKQKIEMATG